MKKKIQKVKIKECALSSFKSYNEKDTNLWKKTLISLR